MLLSLVEQFMLPAALFHGSVSVSDRGINLAVVRVWLGALTQPSAV